MKAGESSPSGAGAGQRGAAAQAFRAVLTRTAVIVVDKPAGMVVHPAAGHASGARQRCSIAWTIQRIGGRSGRASCRLDKGTSGLMVVANDHARELAPTPSARSKGISRWSGASNGRRIDAPIGRDPSNRKKMSSESLRVRRSRAAVLGSCAPNTSARADDGAGGDSHGAHARIACTRHHQGAIVGDALYGGVHRRCPVIYARSRISTVRFSRRAHNHTSGRWPQDGFTSDLPADLQKDARPTREGLQASCTETHSMPTVSGTRVSVEVETILSQQDGHQRNRPSTVGRTRSDAGRRACRDDPSARATSDEDLGAAGGRHPGRRSRSGGRREVRRRSASCPIRSSGSARSISQDSATKDGVLPVCRSSPAAARLDEHRTRMKTSTSGVHDRRREKLDIINRRPPMA